MYKGSDKCVSFISEYISKRSNRFNNSKRNDTWIEILLYLWAAGEKLNPVINSMDSEKDHKDCALRNKFDTLAAKLRSCKGIEIQPVIKNVINKCHQPIITIGRLHKSRKIY